MPHAKQWSIDPSPRPPHCLPRAQAYMPQKKYARIFFIVFRLFGTSFCVYTQTLHFLPPCTCLHCDTVRRCRLSRLHHFQGDIIAGITVGLTVVPQSLAYANIAELPPQVCLFAQSLSSTSTFSGRLNVTLFHLLPYIIDLKFFCIFVHRYE